MIVAPPALRRAVWFMKYTLARPGEMRGLRWREVDLAGRVVRLSRFKCMHKRRDGVRERVIPLVALVVRYLSWLKSRTRPDPDDFVYLNAWSRPWTMNMFRLAMHRACEEAGINDDPNGERIVAYSLRHTGATEATRQGIRDRTLADIMGHTSTNTTARYQHLDKTDLIDALERSMRNQRR